MGSFVGSMCLCLPLSVWVVLTLPLAAYLKWRTKAMGREFDVGDALMTFTYRQRESRGPRWKGPFPRDVPVSRSCVVDVHCLKKKRQRQGHTATTSLIL